MKFRIISLLAILELLSLSACMQDHPNASDVRKEVRISATIGESTHSSVKSRATNTSWENGDAIGLFMKNSDTPLSMSALTVNTKFITVGSTSSFNPESEASKIYFPFHNKKVDFIAYYPYNEKLNDLNYSVDVSDQSNLSSIDLLYSNNAKNMNGTSESVNLVFSHQLTNVILNISMEEAPQEDLTGLTAKITNVATKASFSLVDGTLSNERDSADILFNIASDGKIAEAILLPNRSLTNSSLVFTTKESIYSYDLSQANIDSFNKSTKYSFNVTLKPGQVELKEITATIEDWTDGVTEDITADEVESENSPTDGEEGEESNNPPEGDDPPEETGSVGDGTKENPYNVNQVEDKIEETNVWVQGYIVGHYTSTLKNSFVFGTKGAGIKFIAIASTPAETDSLKTIQVDVISDAGLYIGDKLNLKKNPDNFQKEVYLFGSTKNSKGNTTLTKVRKTIIDGVQYGDTN